MSNPIITATKVKQLTGSSKDIEDRKIIPWVDVVAIELRDDMGVTGYNILTAAIDADDTLASETDLKTLRETYIWPWMAWRVLERAGIAMYVEPSRNGTVTRSSGEASSVTTGQFGMLQTSHRDPATTYKAELYKFLKDNTDTYTWYDVGTSPEVAPQPSTGGVIIRQRRCRYDDE